MLMEVVLETLGLPVLVVFCVGQINGDWMLGYYGSAGFSNSLHVELLALYHGLRIAWQYGYKDLICYTDSTLVINLVHRESNVWHHYAAIINNIKDLVARNWRVCVTHTLRKMQLGWSSSDPPIEVSHCLQSDASRTLIARI